MMKRTQLVAFAIIVLAGFAARAAKAAPAELRPAADNPTKLTVAILDFEAGGKDEKLGKQIPDALSALLSDDEGFQLVERAQVAKAIGEQAVGLTGLTDSEKSIRIGKVVGAQLLVTGKVFTLDSNTYLTAKIIGTETSYVKSVMVKDGSDKDIGALVAQLAEKLTAKLHTGSTLLANDAQNDPIPALKAKLSKLKLPILTVSVTEKHEGPVTVVLIDPAAEVEIRKVLADCGFKIIDDESKSRVKPAMTIHGEAFSEFGALIGNLTSCSARLEIKIVDPRDGTLLFTDRVTSRGVDLSERIAAKTALQRAGHSVAINILNHFASTLPKADPQK
jgi:hypothetical protein